jgi:hypothetical protein
MTNNLDGILVLDQKIQSLVQREREALEELVVELFHLDAVRGFEQFGHNNLFNYLTKRIGYSAGTAQRRIDACRLLKDVPELGAKIGSGALDLHHLTTVSKAIRQVGKTRKISVKEKREVLMQIEKCSEASTQQKVASFFDLEVITQTKRSVQKDSSVRYEISVTSKVAEMIEQAQALVSHAVPTKNLADYLEYVSARIIKEKSQPARANVKKCAIRANPAESSTAMVAIGNSKANQKVELNNSTAIMAVKVASPVGEPIEKPIGKPINKQTLAPPTTANPIPKHLHREVRHAQPECVNCGTRWFPQTDHRMAKWSGGTNERENLQTLCGPCNRAKYRRECHQEDICN